MRVTAEIAGDLLHAMKERFGYEASEVVGTMVQKQGFERRKDLEDPEKDQHEFCAMVDQVAVGTHRWER